MKRSAMNFLVPEGGGRSFAAMALAGLLAASSPAQEPYAPRGSRETLARLDQEVQGLYAEVSRSVVRVQLPAPRLQAQRAAELLKRYPELSETTQEMLRRQAATGEPSAVAHAQTHVFISTTRPATAPAGGGSAGVSDAHSAPWTSERAADGTTILTPHGGASIVIRHGGSRNEDGQIIAATQSSGSFEPAGDFAPNDSGLLIDERGTFLVPKFVDAADFAGHPARIAIDGVETLADFVGSDRQSQITLLRVRPVEGVAFRPAGLAANPPRVGGLVMLITPQNNSGRLVVWTGNLQDAGIVASIDGSISGFVRFGQFFSARAAKPVIDQLGTHGVVRRATLGLGVAMVRDSDPIRRANPLIGTRPAVRITTVDADSIAAKAGMVRGDVIFQLAGEPVGDPPTFAAFLSARTGKTAVEVLRGEETQILTLDLPTLEDGDNK